MILIPVKDLSGAKQRLSSVLDQPRRTRLTRAMLKDVLAALAPLRPAVPITLVTGDAFARSLAEHYGFAVLHDADNPGETGAIEAATQFAAAQGAEFTLVIPADIPLVTAEEIAVVLQAAPERGTVLAPAADGRGTNAVLRRPAALFPLRFGNDSFQPHLAAARATGLPVQVLELPGIALDVDRPGDLAQLLRRPLTTATQELLCEWDFPVRWGMAGESP